MFKWPRRRGPTCAERRLRREVKALRRTVRDLEARLAVAEAQALAREAEVEAFQTAHQRTLSMIHRQTVALDAQAGLTTSLAGPRRRSDGILR